MPKRKTRQEKIKSDHRRELSFGQEATFSYQITHKKQESPKVQTQPIPIITAPKSIILYPYLRADLRKTMMLTAFIIVAQFILYFLLKNHAFALPGLIY
jgi:hypothetical protein